MLKIEKKWAGWLIAGKIFFGEEETAKITLRLTKWEEMRYDDKATHIIDFPGEYDVSDVSIICFEADKKLSYILVLGKERIALLQNAAAMEVTSFDHIDTWLCMDESVKEEVERLEMEGEIRMMAEDPLAVSN